MLLDDRIRTKHRTSFRRAVQTASAALNSWILASGLTRRIERGAPHLPLNPELPLQQCTGPRFVLEACCRVTRPPNWIRRFMPKGVELTWRRFDVGDSSCIQPEPEGSMHSPRRRFESAVGSAEVDRIHASLRRVTSMFLRRTSSSHSQCLDTPAATYALYGTSHKLHDELLQCCPVALGFWLWRKAASKDPFFRRVLLLPNLRLADIDRILFATSRSHLHYCIYAACRMAIRTTQRRREGDSALLEAIGKDSDWIPLMTNINRYLPCTFSESGWLDHLRVSVDDLIRTVKCPGARPFLRSLVRYNEMIGVPWARIPRDAEWLRKGYRQETPFRRTQTDHIFLDTEPEQDALKHLRISRTHGANIRATIIDSAINSKAN